MKRYFVTGTDTDAGKTFVSSILLHHAQQSGFSCFGLKPVAAGCQPDAEHQWVNDDALALQAASAPAQDYPIHNPIALAPAIAPHIAAAEIHVPLSSHGLLEQCQPGLQQAVDIQLVEGAGGWLVPLNERETLADFAQLLDADIILVVGMKLGCINHALLTQAMIQQSGLNLVGWVANHVDPDMSRADENFSYLNHHIEAPCLGRIPYSPDTLPEQLTQHICHSPFK